MNKVVVVLSVIGALSLGALLSSFYKPAATHGSKKFMQITAVESLVSGGFARSKLVTTTADSKVEIQELEHFYSMVGLKFENIMMNDVTISKKLEELSAQGWDLVSSNSTFGTREGGGSQGGGNGMIITRYVLCKDVN